MRQTRIFSAACFICVVFSFLNLHAQKRLISAYDQVTAAARVELDSLLAAGGAVQLEAATLKIHGKFVMDITLHEKGKVLSVFMVYSEADDVTMQNNAKDLARRIEFGFKMPKGRTYKFQYAFDLKE